MPGPLYLKNPRSNNTLPEADWLLTCAASDGAIAQTPGDEYVLPYMANYAAMGLARAYEITGNSKYIGPVWDWLAWYRDRMNPTDGSVDDYNGPVGARADLNRKDSTDAYAGTYLVALYLAYWASPDGETRLANFVDSIPLALTAIESTQQVDGLTYALSTYDVKYLEDNVETLAGVRAAEALASVSVVANTHPELLARAQTTGDALAKGIGYFWNHDAGSWDFAIHASHYYARNDWNDENAQRQQIWATAWGAIASKREAIALLTQYQLHAPGWSTKTSSYEPMGIWAYRNAQDHNTANAASIILQKASWDNAHHYPWTCQISGILLLGMAGFSPAMPALRVAFPDGQNRMPDPKLLVDSNSDGKPDIITGVYGNPTFSLHPLVGDGNYLWVDVPDGNGWAFNWDYIPVEENTYITFSLWRKIVRLGVGASFNIKYEQYDNANNMVTYGYTPLSAEVDLEFKRIFINQWIPPGVTKIKPVFEVNSGTVLLAYPQVEISGSPTAPPYGVPVPAPTGF